MKIKWALNELAKYNEEPLNLSGEFNLEEGLKRRSKEILASNKISFNGWLLIENKREYIVSGEITAWLTLPSSRSLEPVDVEITIPFSEVYLAPGYVPEEDKYGEDEIVTELESEVLDLSIPFEDSILTGLPSQVYTEEELQQDKMPEGNYWQVVSENDHKKGVKKDESSSEDSPFAALKELFSEEDDEEHT